MYLNKRRKQESADCKNQSRGLVTVATKVTTRGISLEMLFNKSRKWDRIEWGNLNGMIWDPLALCHIQSTGSWYYVDESQQWKLLVSPGLRISSPGRAGSRIQRWGMVPPPFAHGCLRGYFFIITVPHSDFWQIYVFFSLLFQCFPLISLFSRPKSGSMFCPPPDFKAGGFLRPCHRQNIYFCVIGGPISLNAES